MNLLKKHDIYKPRVCTKDKMFLIIKKIPILNKTLKDVDSKCEYILADYIHDIVIYLSKTGWVDTCTYYDGFTNTVTIESEFLDEMYKCCLKINNNLEFKSFEKMVYDKLELFFEAAEVFED